MIHSIIFWILTCFVTLVYFPFIILVLLIFFKSKEKIEKIAVFFRRLWGRSLIFISGSKLEIQGLNNLNKGETYILMPNHQSMFDIFALCILPFNFLWFAKHSLYKIPIFGLILKLVGSVPVDRSSLKKSYNSFKTAEDIVKKNRSVLFFPEGTRNTDNKLLPFKTGGFRLAITTGKKIVPISILGSGKIQKRGEFTIIPGTIKIIISPPIATDRYSMKEKGKLMNKVKEAIEKNLS